MRNEIHPSNCRDELRQFDTDFDSFDTETLRSQMASGIEARSILRCQSVRKCQPVGVSAPTLASEAIRELLGSIVQV
jgi:hypothetical protein